MPSDRTERNPGAEPIPGVTRVNHVIFWGAGQLCGRSSSTPTATPQIDPAFGQAALVERMSLEAEATQLEDFREMAALMEEAPGA